MALRVEACSGPGKKPWRVLQSLRERDEPTDDLSGRWVCMLGLREHKSQLESKEGFLQEGTLS